jgi:hypothetical protein
MTYSFAANIFNKNKDSFFLSAGGMIIHEWDHLLWDPFLWPDSGLAELQPRTIDVVMKHEYPSLSIAFSSGMTWPERRICAAPGDKQSQMFWKAMRTQLKPYSGRSIILNGIFVKNWQYSPATTSPRGSKSGVVNTLFFDIGQYGIEGQGNRMLIFNDSETCTPFFVMGPSAAPRNHTAVARVRVDNNVFLDVVIHAAVSLDVLKKLICTHTKRDANSYILMPEKPFMWVLSSDTTSVCFPSCNLSMNPTVTAPSGYNGSEFYASANPSNSLFLCGGVPTPLVLSKKPYDDFVKVEAVEIVDEVADSRVATLSVWKDATVQDFAVNGRPADDVSLYGIYFEDNLAPAPFASRAEDFNQDTEADLVILSTGKAKEPDAVLLDNMLAETHREQNVRNAHTARMIAEKKAQASAKRKANEDRKREEDERVEKAAEEARAAEIALATAAAEAARAEKLRFEKERRDKTRRLATINRLAAPSATNLHSAVACAPDVANISPPSGPLHAAAANIARPSPPVIKSVEPPHSATQSTTHAPSTASGAAPPHATAPAIRPSHATAKVAVQPHAAVIDSGEPPAVVNYVAPTTVSHSSANTQTATSARTLPLPPQVPAPAQLYLTPNQSQPSYRTKLQPAKVTAVPSQVVSPVGAITVHHIDGRSARIEFTFQGLQPCVPVLSVIDMISGAFDLGNSVNSINFHRNKKYYRFNRGGSLSLKDFVSYSQSEACHLYGMRSPSSSAPEHFDFWSIDEKESTPASYSTQFTKNATVAHTIEVSPTLTGEALLEMTRRTWFRNEPGYKDKVSKAVGLHYFCGNTDVPIALNLDSRLCDQGFPCSFTGDNERTFYFTQPPTTQHQP